jgi:ankyrin repeat protein
LSATAASSSTNTQIAALANATTTTSSSSALASTTASFGDGDDLNGGELASRDSTPSLSRTFSSDAASPRMSDAEVEAAKQKLLAAVIGRDTYRLQSLVKNVRKATKGDLSYREGKDGLTLLHRAVIQGGDTLVVEQLLNNGAKINMGDNHERTALFHAASRGDMPAIKLLIERKADVCAQDCSKQNVLHVIARGGLVEALELLLDSNAQSEINAEDKDGMTPLHYATKSDFRECVRILIAHGADANARNYLNRTPRDMISRVGSKTPEAKWIAKQLKKQERRNSSFTISHIPDLPPPREARSHSLVHRLLTRSRSDRIHPHAMQSSLDAEEREEIETAKKLNQLDQYGFWLTSKRYRQEPK